MQMEIETISYMDIWILYINTYVKIDFNYIFILEGGKWRENERTNNGTGRGGLLDAEELNPG